MSILCFNTHTPTKKISASRRTLFATYGINYPQDGLEKRVRECMLVISWKKNRREQHKYKTYFRSILFHHIVAVFCNINEKMRGTKQEKAGNKFVCLH